MHRGPPEWAARFTSYPEVPMWVNILSGAITMTLEAWMQASQWLWF